MVARVAMRAWSLIHVIGFISLVVLLCCETCLASIRNYGKLKPGFEGAPMTWIDNNGLLLLSNQSEFAFGFVTTEDVTLFLLCVVHMDSMKVVWTANRGNPVSNSDKFMFDDKGSVSLQKGGSVVWSVDNDGKTVTALELQDSGNLVLLGDEDVVVWQSFSHPTDTLLWGQEFREGMKLQSEPSASNVTYVLEIKFGDLVLSAGYKTPQPYWSMGKESRKTINKDGGAVTSATISANSWKFYDSSKVLLWQFIFSSNTDVNATWIAVLGNDGVITFSDLQNGASNGPSTTKIPSDSCSTPEPCDSYFECYNNKCQCPSGLNSRANCKSGIVTSCSKDSTELTSAGDGLYYFALGFVTPSSRSDLEGCKSSCLANCSCVAVFYQNTTRNCYMFDRIGSFQNSDLGFVSFVKVSSDGSSGGKKPVTYIILIIVFTTIVIICGLLFGGYRYYKGKRNTPAPSDDNSEENNFLDNLTGMPVRFSYKDLQTATNNFSKKLGQGGFGSVYEGVLPDGTRLAVKKLEGIGQGKKEFRAEVSIIGSIHHVHLVRLRGFCAEGHYRLLAYEYMANGSLDKWIFRKSSDEDFLLDWDTRFNIAVGTAKGLAYLHEDCDSKIIHCDIKPENVLLDNNYSAKVSDFGLAKLMTREQSHVFTTMRGTRGYLAPEWITNYAISEKSDVYSYGMLLLEIIGGRKNYDPSETSEKSHFPSYAFKMLEEGKLKEIFDSKVRKEDVDERISMAIMVALWCIQEDMTLRPAMTKVVQMLEGICPVYQPPTSSTMGFCLSSSFFKSTSEGGTSSGPSDCNSEAYQSAVRLSGPR